MPRLVFPCHAGFLLLAAICLTPQARAGEIHPVQVLFASAEIKGSGAYTTSGFKRALSGGLDEDGFFLLQITGSGVKRESVTLSFAGGRVVTTFRTVLAEVEVSLLGGYQWTAPGRMAFVAIGPDYAQTQVFAALPGGRVWAARWGEPRFGVRLLAEYWHETDAGLMTSGTIAASGARRSLWLRAAAGFAPLPASATGGRAYIGPELILYAQADGYRQARLGLHITGIALGPFRMRLTGGYGTDSNRSAEGYVTATLSLRR